MSFAADMGAAEGGSFGPIPEGDYALKIKSSELVDNKSSQGNHVYVQLEVASGSHAGHVIHERYNYNNANETAQKIGRSRFKALCLACGMSLDENRVIIDDRTGEPISGPRAIAGRLVLGTVGIRQDDGYEPANEIKNVTRYDGAPTGQSGGYATDMGGF